MIKLDIRIKILVIFTLLILLGFNLFSQNCKIDSLENIANSSNVLDTTKINCLIELERCYYNKRVKSFGKYVDTIILGSKKINYLYGLSRGYYNGSLSEQLKGNYLKALDQIYQSIEYAKKGEVYNQLAISYAQLSMLLQRNTNNYYKKDNYQTILNYLNEGLKSAYKSNNYNTIHILLIKNTIIRLDNNDYKSAREYIDKAKFNSKYIKDSIYILDICMQEGRILTEEGYYEKALKSLNKANEIQASLSSNTFTGLIYHHIANVYNKLKNYELAEKFYKKSILENKLVNPDVQLALIKTMKNFYVDTKDYKNSIYYTDLYYKLKDSISAISNIHDFNELMFKYNTALKDKENTELKLQNQKNERSLNFILGILLLFVIGILLLTYLYRKLLFTKEKLGLINQELETSNLYKDMIFKIVSHDLKMPTNNLLTLTQRLDAKIPNISTDWLIDYSKKINLIAVNTVNTVNNLLFWSNKEANNSVIIEDIYVFDCIHDILETFNIYAKVLQKTLSFECENRNLKIKCNRVQFLTLLKNIISNAIKYSALDNGVILIKTFAENDHVIITVEDNGNGDFEKVSSIFFSTEQNKLESHMSGMGFKICKEIATNYSIIISFHQSENLKGIKVGIKI